MQKKIVLVGGPGTGKTSVINELKSRGYTCMNEISREVTSRAQKEGIEQLFLNDPLLFSEKLLQGRVEQFKRAEELNDSFIFFDRGIPDVEAYLSYSSTKYPNIFSEKAIHFRYNDAFYFHPWEDIYKNDNERYESFTQAKIIDKFLVQTYQKYDYRLIDMPFVSIEDRVDFILKSIS